MRGVGVGPAQKPEVRRVEHRFARGQSDEAPWKAIRQVLNMQTWRLEGQLWNDRLGRVCGFLSQGKG